MQLSGEHRSLGVGAVLGVLQSCRQAELIFSFTAMTVSKNTKHQKLFAGKRLTGPAQCTPTTPTTKRSPFLNNEVFSLMMTTHNCMVTEDNGELRGMSWTLGRIVLFWSHLSMDRYLGLIQVSEALLNESELPTSHPQSVGTALELWQWPAVEQPERHSVVLRNEWLRATTCCDVSERKIQS